MRKSPEQQIQEARAALQRAQVRQRKEDTRQKIIVGATSWNWLCRNPNAARSFIAFVKTTEIREQDKPLLEDAISELEKAHPGPAGE